MFEVIYMKAEFEPWWMFEDWEKEIVTRHSFQDEEAARNYLHERLRSLEETFPNMTSKKDCFFAFWTDEEKVFCEACDDDLQIYHGLLLFNDGNPFIK